MLGSRSSHRCDSWGRVLLFGGVTVLGSWSAPSGVAAWGQVAGTSTTSRSVSAPPYYRGEVRRGEAGVGHLPVSVVVGGDQDLPEEWSPTAALERLSGDMTAWIESAGGSLVLASIEGSPRFAPPRVVLGCSLDPTGECAEEPRQNVLETTSASKAWRELLAGRARAAGVDRIVVLQIDLAPQWIHQRNLKGAKEVRLGTGHTQSLPWLTSLDTPVYVLQLTGAVLDGEGKILRSGGEGLWAVRTPFRASVLGAQKLISEEDVERLRTQLVRDDVPGSPLVWQVALQELLSQLLGSG